MDCLKYSAEKDPDREIWPSKNSKFCRKYVSKVQTSTFFALKSDFTMFKLEISTKKWTCLINKR
jgi:hypothetical protein